MGAKKKTMTKLIVDGTIFVGFLVAMNPRMTGIAVHEWLTVTAMAVVITHLLLSWDWIVQVTKRFLKMSAIRPRLNYVLNLLLFIDVTLIMYTGLMISQSVVPALGLALPRNFTMRGLHELAANLFILLLGLHVGLHWNWILDTFRRHVVRPTAALRPAKRMVQPVEKVEVQP